MSEDFNEMALRVADDLHGFLTHEEIIAFATRIRDELLPADMVLLPRKLTKAMARPMYFDKQESNQYTWDQVIAAYEKENGK